MMIWTFGNGRRRQASALVSRVEGIAVEWVRTENERLAVEEVR